MEKKIADSSAGIFHGIPQIEYLQEWMTLQSPFEYNDFMYPDVLCDEAELQRRVECYRALRREGMQDTLHGPFLDITLHSADPEIRSVSERRVRQAAEAADSLGVKGMVLHTNLIPNFYDTDYRQNWLDSNEAFLGRLLEEFPSLSVYMENMFDEEPDSLVRLAERMRDQRFGICLDVGHAHISRAGVQIWHEACRPYIRHYHLNDNDGQRDLHLPLGEGAIPWEEILPMIKPDASALIEVRSLDGYEKSLTYIREKIFIR